MKLGLNINIQDRDRVSTGVTVVILSLLAPQPTDSTKVPLQIAQLAAPKKVSQLNTLMSLNPPSLVYYYLGTPKT